MITNRDNTVSVIMLCLALIVIVFAGVAVLVVHQAVQHHRYQVKCHALHGTVINDYCIDDRVLLKP